MKYLPFGSCEMSELLLVGWTRIYLGFRKPFLSRFTLTSFFVIGLLSFAETAISSILFAALIFSSPPSSSLPSSEWMLLKHPRPLSPFSYTLIDNHFGCGVGNRLYFFALTSTFVLGAAFFFTSLARTADTEFQPCWGQLLAFCPFFGCSLFNNFGFCFLPLLAPVFFFSTGITTCSLPAIPAFSAGFYLFDIIQCLAEFHL